MLKMKKIFLVHRVLFVIMILTTVLGLFCQWIYYRSSEKAISVNDVENIIGQKEKEADLGIAKIANMLHRGSEDSLRWLISETSEITYFVYKNNDLIFWSNNGIKRTLTESSQWKYYETGNAHILAKSIEIDAYRIVSYILLKYNYPYENNELKNTFPSEFELNKEIKIITDLPSDKYAIFSEQHNNYLFTLQPPPHKIYNETWAKISLSFFTLCFLLMFYLYANIPFLLKRVHLSRKEFFCSSSIMLVLNILLLTNDIPSTFFGNNIFTPFGYASNSLFSTLTHLSFFTAYIFSTIYLFAVFSREKSYITRLLLNKLILLLLPPAYYLIMFYVFEGLVFNSSTYLNVLRVDDISLTTLWNHFLLLVWGVGFLILCSKVIRMALHKSTLKQILGINIISMVIFVTVCAVVFRQYTKEAILFYLLLMSALYLPKVYTAFTNRTWFLVLYLAVFSLFVVTCSIQMNLDKKFDQFHLLAENLYFNESSQEEKFTESMLADLENELNNDIFFRKIGINSDSVTATNNYLNNTYLRGFWNKYEIKLHTTFAHSETDNVYQDLLKSEGGKIANTHFYKISRINTDMVFLGEFVSENKKNTTPIKIFLEFYPRSNYVSYSYPNLLIESPPTIQSQFSLSVARYFRNDLTYSSGKFKYPRNYKWIYENNKNDKNYFVRDFSSCRHYIYTPNAYNFLVISEEDIPSTTTYLMYFVYTFVVFAIACLLIMWLYNIANKGYKIKYNLTSKLLVAFISLMLVCFSAIFYTSLTYTQKRYREIQVKEIELKKNYIQSALQEKYYWTQHLDSTNISILNFDLQDLSYTYQTDINVYDNGGMLIGSSQPAIFSKNLISKLISPKPFFSNNPNIDQYEHIGKLEYLAMYTDFYNGDFLQIGYISIPQFLSKDEYNADVQSFLTVIVHISLIIIMLFIFLSIVIGKQLTAPLTMIEERLKDIRLGKKNKKIDYKANNEIGQLVAQYNKAVDELEKSARLLASSERESAWKQMARQVAHEINNPLTPMKLTIQQLQRTKKMGDKGFESYFEKSTATLIEQIENLSRIAGTFSTFARLPEPNFETVDVAQKLNLVIQLFSNNNKNIKIDYLGANEGVFAYTDKEQLIQVFNNLLKNAVQAIPLGKTGKIEIVLSETPDTIHIAFKDNGKGISDEIKGKIFLPNFTTKSTGMGMGLAICKNIISASGGDITFESEEEKGTIFHISLLRKTENS